MDGIRESGEFDGKEDYLSSHYIYPFLGHFCRNRLEKLKGKHDQSFIEKLGRGILENKTEGINWK